MESLEGRGENKRSAAQSSRCRFVLEVAHIGGGQPQRGGLDGRTFWTFAGQDKDSLDARQ